MINGRWNKYRGENQYHHNERKTNHSNDIKQIQYNKDRKSERIVTVGTTIWFEKYRKIINIVLITTAILSGFLGAVIYASSKWVLSTWNNVSLDEMIFHLKVPIEGTSQDLIKDYFNVCVSTAVIIMFVIILVFIGMRNQPQFRRLLVGVIMGASAWAIITSCNLLWNELSVGDYIKSQTNKSLFIQNNYVDPRSVKIQFPENKRNLIYIFLESMETTYMDVDSGGGFSTNYIPELTELAKNNVHFSKEDKIKGAYTTSGATWTMGGLFAQTSGLPLKVPIDGNSMNEQEDFFPDIVTLGDILEEEGYKQELLIGSDATFGGRENYFKQHGNYEMFDLYTAKEREYISLDYAVWWGYEDEKLFEYAQKELADLSAERDPFNFTMLTADTHFEDGYVCPECQNEYGDNQYANVLACSSRKVNNFVSWIQEQDFYENTTIVLVGDHLTMDSDFCDSIDVEYDRGVYFTIINSAVQAQNNLNREYTTMDMFPTTLASMGVGIEGEMLGLGTNLFSTRVTLVEEYGFKNMNKELDRKSEFFNNFTKSIVINQKKSKSLGIGSPSSPLPPENDVSTEPVAEEVPVEIPTEVPAEIDIVQ